jgi:hypothetical protein
MSISGQRTRFCRALSFWAVYLPTALHLGLCQPLPGADSQPPKTIRMEPARDGTLRVLSNGKPVATLEQLRKSGESVILDGLRFRMSDDLRGISVTDMEKEVRIEAGGYDGWFAILLPGEQVGLVFDAVQRTVEIQAHRDNKTLLKLGFFDGGAAEMQAGSIGRMEVFADESYYFWGSGRIRTLDPNGKWQELTPHGPHLGGGKLVKVMNEKGEQREERETPLREVHVSGGIGAEIVVEIEKQIVKLLPGEKKSMSLRNGSLIAMHHDEHFRSLQWEVPKGLFRFVMDGFECWRALGVSGHKASMVWDKDSKSVDLGNKSTNNPASPYIPVRFNRQITAAVNPSSMLQYTSIEECHTYAVSATGAPVTVYNAYTRQESALGVASVLVRPGFIAPGAGRAESLAAQNVRLTWQEGAPLEVSGTMGTRSIQVATSETLANPLSASEFSIRYPRSGSMSLNAVSGNYVFGLASLSGWLINLPEGQTLDVDVDLQRGVFIARTSAENKEEVGITTADGFSPKLGPDSVLTILIGRNQNIPGAGSGNIVLFEGAGADINPAVGPPQSLPPGVFNEFFGSQLHDLPYTPPQPEVSATGRP